MFKWKTFLCIVGMISLVACNVFRIYQDRFDLPDGTSVQTADEIVTLILRDNFSEKLAAKFPHLGSNVKFGLGSLVSTPLVGGEKKVFIVLFIRYTGKFDNPEEVGEYSKTIVEQKVKEYFQGRFRQHAAAGAATHRSQPRSSMPCTAKTFLARLTCESNHFRGFPGAL